MEDSAVDSVLALEDRLVEEVEEGLFASVDVVVASEHEFGRCDGLCFELAHSGLDIDSQLPKCLHLITVSQLVHEAANLLHFLGWVLDGRLRDFLPPHLVEVFGNSSHEAEFREK